MLHVEVHDTPEGCYSRYEDGASYGAHPHDTPDYREITRRCGYDDDILAFCRDHERAHHFVANEIFGQDSYVLHSLAHNLPIDQHRATLEEAFVQLFQRWVRAGERPILEFIDWDLLKNRFTNNHLRQL